MKNKKRSAEFQDLEGTQFSISFNPHWNKFNISITDSFGRGTNSIVIGYEDLRSIFKEAENIWYRNNPDSLNESGFSKPNVVES